MELSLGTTASAEIVVSGQDLANALVVDNQDSFPAVLATARMIALMETAAARAMSGVLKAGELSVGVTVDVIHSAPTALGDQVTAIARFLGIEDEKFYLFEVSAHDSGGEIGRGKHKRAVVTTDRLVAKAELRKAKK